MRLKQRIEALETRGRAYAPWVVIKQYADQTEEKATAAYEAAHGPIPNCNSILRVIVRKPEPA